MKAIVTGGAGFIGSHIAQRLLDLGHDVIVIDDLSAGKIENVPLAAELFNYDITNPLLYTQLPNCDVVFHNAASKKNICLKDPIRDAIVNATGTLRLLEFARLRGVKKFIHASTGSVYGEVKRTIIEETPVNPVSYYGISKLAGENYVRHCNLAYGLDTTILRYFHVYGERQEDDPLLGGVVAIFERLLKKGKPITIHGDGEQERVFTHVDDIVNANIAAWENPESKGQIYNCSSKKRITINELVDILGKRLGVTPKIVYGPELEGDIKRFSVDSWKISEIGVKFRDYE